MTEGTEVMAMTEVMVVMEVTEVMEAIAVMGGDEAEMEVMEV